MDLAHSDFFSESGFVPQIPRVCVWCRGRFSSCHYLRQSREKGCLTQGLTVPSLVGVLSSLWVLCEDSALETVS